MSEANEPAERREAAKRRASDAAGESEGRSPSDDIVQHDAYHAGQIAILKRTLGA